MEPSLTPPRPRSVFRANPSFKKQNDQGRRPTSGRVVKISSNIPFVIMGLVVTFFYMIIVYFDHPRHPLPLLIILILPI